MAGHDLPRDIASKADNDVDELDSSEGLGVLSINPNDVSMADLLDGLGGIDNIVVPFSASATQHYDIFRQ